MTFDIGLTLGIVLVAIVLFATEKLRVDVIALLILLTVALTILGIMWSIWVRATNWRCPSPD